MPLDGCTGVRAAGARKPGVGALGAAVLGADGVTDLKPRGAGVGVVARGTEGLIDGALREGEAGVRLGRVERVGGLMLRVGGLDSEGRLKLRLIVGGAARKPGVEGTVTFR